MPKDYAKKIEMQQSKKGQKSRRGVVLILILALTAAAIVSVSFSDNTRIKTTLLSWTGQIKSWIGHKKANSDKMAEATQTTKPKEVNDIQFDFYTELPKMQVNLPIAQAEKKVVAAPIEKPAIVKPVQKDVSLAQSANYYVVQLGVFNNQASAAEQRLSYLLAGIDADVVKDEQAQYRIQQGPFATENLAKLTQNRLRKKGIDSVIKKISD